MHLCDEMYPVRSSHNYASIKSILYNDRLNHKVAWYLDIQKNLQKPCKMFQPMSACTHFWLMQVNILADALNYLATEKDTDKDFQNFDVKCR